ncbi:Kelch-like ECH-associated protein 1 [Hypsibius exemplaris]|uniref:Kelch-like ECH-associated protein 1 n=1 Tax=Hypsibius exemplaris TaxID=2072580 RepID=A0A1W0X1K9_HYPEX|nr:Kelch-like ECH-associated protein 1 [Hypsibius exemplaris]
MMFLMAPDSISQALCQNSPLVGPCNALGIADFANQHGCTSLTKTTREFIDKHCADVSETDEFLQQSVCQLINLIKRDELVVKSESEVYNAVMLWIKYDEKNRRPHLEDIVYVVRCYFLSPDFLERQLKSCEVLKSHPNCRQYLEKIMCDLTSHKKCQMRRRRNPDLPTVIYVVGGYIRYSLSRLECFDPKATSWRTLKDMPTCRSGVCAAFVHGLLYVAGGHCAQSEGNSDSSSMDAYDPFSDSWRSCSAMSVARSRAAAVALDNQFYVVGGSMQTTFHRSGERYNPNDETWSPIADMSRARLGLGVASLNRLLYAVGGFDGVERLQCVECYDPDTNSWRYVAPMSTVRSGAGVVALDGLLYAVGGYDGRNQLASVERYDSEADRWSPVAGMHTARSALSVVAVDGRIYAIGGTKTVRILHRSRELRPRAGRVDRGAEHAGGAEWPRCCGWWGSCCYAESASPTPR